MTKRKEEFISSIPASNTEWAAQQIVEHFSTAQFMELQACFGMLDEILYKSWGKDMSFSNLKEAVDMAAEIC